MAAASLAAFLLAACSASAAKRPKISWTLPTDVDAGAPLKFGWTATGLSAKHRLLVQKRTGTAGVWRTVISLPRQRTGSAQLSGLALGVYRYRIAIRNAKRKVVAENVRTVRVYGPVSLARLLNSNEERTYTTPSNTFAYVLVGYLGTEDTPHTLFTSRVNYCRAIHLEFLNGDSRQRRPTGTLKVVQETLDPVSVSMPYETKGSLAAPLVPGRNWSISAAGSPDLGYMYVNGFGRCYRNGSLVG